MNVAGTILEQLGGQRFQTMTGARDFVSDTNRLSFRLPRAKSGINHISITLDASDTYTVIFSTMSISRHRGVNMTEVKKVSPVYIETLRQVFTDHTGLRCSL